MSTPAAPHAASEQDPLTRMIDLLEQEYAALRAADGAAVARIADAKRQLTEALAGLADTPPAALLRRCHELNRRNGELLHLQQGMLTRALRVMSGGAADATTYGARGQAQADAAGRHIASV
jgi:flagellar biosynthesis/type III secretory pathway chaperone